MLAYPGAALTVYGSLQFSVYTGMGIYLATRPREWLPAKAPAKASLPLPTVAVSNRGATVALAGSF
jgi:hypothetical protein